MLGQQITAVESPFHIKQGVARLINVRGHFLKGEILGDDCWITLDATPHYHANLSIHGAQLQEYARTISGRQSYRGNIDGHDRAQWLGQRRAQPSRRRRGAHHRGRFGRAAAQCSGLRPRSIAVSNNLVFVARQAAHPGKDGVRFGRRRVHDRSWPTTFDPIKFTGNAFSLLGQGTMNPQGNLDLRLNVLWGRDRLHIPLLSDFTREASTPIVIAHVVGTPSYPQFDIKPLPLFNELIKALGRGRAERQLQ